MGNIDQIETFLNPLNALFYPVKAAIDAHYRFFHT
jgi:hypothetical protein